jgi:site-specific recombinase XerC
MKRPALKASLVDLEISGEALEAELSARGSAIGKRRRKIVPESALRRGVRGWYLRYRTGKDEAGRWLRPSSFLGPFSELATRAAAQQAAELFLAKILPAERAPGASPPWSTFCESYLRDRVPLMRYESQRTTRSVIRNHVSPQFTRLRVHEVSAARIQTWIVHMRERRTPVSTIRHRVGILITMLHAAAAGGLSAEIPSRLLYPKTHKVKRTHDEVTFTPEEASALIAAAVFPWRVAFALALYSGLRASEIAGLEWKHVDLAGARLTIAQQAQHGETVLPKSDDSVATIDMPRELVELLEAYRRECPAEARFLFVNRAGRPITSGTIRDRHLNPLCARLGIPRKGLHARRRGDPRHHRADLSLREPVHSDFRRHLDRTDGARLSDSTR